MPRTEAQDSLQHFLQKAQKAENYLSQKEALLDILQWGLHHRPILTRYYSDTLQEEAQIQGDSAGLIQALYFQAQYYQLLDDFSLALERLQHAEKIAALLGAKRSLALIHRSFSSIYLKLHSVDQALTHYERSAHYYRQVNEPIEAALNLSQYGEILFQAGKLSEALHFSDSCLNQMLALEAKEHIATCYRKSGSLLVQLGEHDQASTYLHEALRRHINRGEGLGSAQTLSYLADNSFRQRNYQESRHYLQQSRKANSSIGNQSIKMRNLKTAYRLDSAQQNIAAAFFSLKEYSRELQGAFGKSLRSQKEVFQFKNQLVQQEHELSLLATQSELQQKQIEAQQNRILLLISVILGSLFTLFITLRGFRQIKKQNSQITRQSHVIEHQRNLLKKANEELENQVAQRTAELEERYRQLRQFAFTNAHEVRGPLSRILMITSLMGKKDFPLKTDEKQEFIKNLHCSAREMDDVLHKIRDQLSLQ